MMREDPAVFDVVRFSLLFLPFLAHANPQYHKGFRRQVESWPSNPVSHYISELSSHPLGTVIADLGCGDAALARALIPKGYTVMSFDLVADHAFVVEADIFDRLPLPGSEVDSDDSEDPGQGHAQIVNVVVCALSLMGTNWPNCVREAWRILRPKCAFDLYHNHHIPLHLCICTSGELKIAEVASRFTNVQQFQCFIESFGFKHKSTVRVPYTLSHISPQRSEHRIPAIPISHSLNSRRPVVSHEARRIGTNC